MNHHEHSTASMAPAATLHCLTGCAVGEIAGLLIGTAAGLGAGATLALAVGLAFFAGYSLSTLPLLRFGLSLRRALATVVAADTLSILTMEIVDNGVMAVVPGAMGAGLDSPVFWASMGLALTLAYAAALPVNTYLLARGRGHALTHSYHGEANPVGWRARLPVIPSVILACSLAAFLLGGFVASWG